ncbi:hypothetical protein [Clostridium sp. C2-6-12]|nr:hypothetical protein [Clostridium sp. C2-6-12]
MRMPTLNELIAAGEELFKWGIGIAVYLIITILIGLTIYIR